MGLNKYKGFVGGDPLPAENVNSIDPENITPQSAGYLTGGANPSLASVFQSLGAGANNGKFKINADGTIYDNVPVDLAPPTNINVGGTGSAYGLYTHTCGQSFTLTKETYITQIGLYTGRSGVGSNYYFGMSLYNANTDGTPTGSALATVSINVANPPYLSGWQYLTVNQTLPAGKYHLACPQSYQSYEWYAQVYYNTSSYSGGSAFYDGVAQAGKNLYMSVQVGTTLTYSSIASSVQAGIRSLTSGSELVSFNTDHFIITSGTSGGASKILKLMSPTTGTDISGAGATPYLDCATNGVETSGNGEDYNLVRVGADGLLPKTLFPSKNYSTEDQAITASTRTYIAGSLLQVRNFLKVGSMLRWKFNMTKTGAGTASSTFDICFGTAGTVSDTARISFTKPAGTAVADEGWVEIMATVRSIGATGIVIGEFQLVHNLASTGHATIPCVVANGISSGFDLTVPNLKVGVCITSGASDAITIKMVQAEIIQL